MSKHELMTELEELQIRWSTEQDRLSKLVVTYDDFNTSQIKIIAGVDISFKNPNEKRDHDDGTEAVDMDEACVGITIFSYPDLNLETSENYVRNLKLLTSQTELVKITQPYIPGFLAFREVDHIIGVLEKVILSNSEHKPDVIMVDGNGILHPRGLGLASHLGVLTGIPTIGVGKTLFHIDGIDESKLVWESTPTEKEKQVELVGDTGKVWGMAVYGCGNSTRKPLIVSIGHRISLITAVEIVKSTAKFRIPEPIRHADQLTRTIIRKLTRSKAPK